jgi:hypothetical protein
VANNSWLSRKPSHGVLRAMILKIPAFANPIIGDACRPTPGTPFQQQWWL